MALAFKVVQDLLVLSDYEVQLALLDLMAFLEQLDFRERLVQQDSQASQVTCALASAVESLFDPFCFQSRGDQ